VTDGQSFSYAFEPDGFYDVRCNIHAAMAAAIVATSSPYAAVADSSGNFRLDDIPQGSYTVTIYTGWDPIVKTITVSAPHTEVDLSSAPGS